MTLSVDMDAVQRAAYELAEVEETTAAELPDRPWIQAAERLREMARDRPHPGYQSLADALADDRRDTVFEQNAEVGNAFNRLVMFRLAKPIIHGTVAFRVQLNESIRNLVVREAGRILVDLARDPGAGLDIESDYFKKDLALAAGCLIPAGAELIQPGAGLPRSLVIRGGARQCYRAIRYLLLQRRGFANYCALHMDSRNLDEFSPEGWLRTYLRIAEFLRLNPDIQGIFGTAWFYDPAVSEISPHLAYLRTTREAGGACNFRYGPSEEVTRNALSRGRVRTQRYNEGRYRPEGYYLVWHRRELLNWATSHGASGHDTH